MCPGFQPVSPYPAMCKSYYYTNNSVERQAQIDPEDLCKLDPVCVVTDPGEDSRQPRLMMIMNYHNNTISQIAPLALQLSAPLLTSPMSLGPVCLL